MNTNWKKDYPLATNLSEIELSEHHSLSKMFRLVGENKRVLDFGCATGYFAQLLTKKGCTVTGIEINSDAAKVAEQYCEQVIVADLDLVSLTEILPERSFDVAVFGDVLEHLRDPWRLLKETQQLLNLEAYVVASIPNIAHGAIRLALLQGKFEYTELGILDNTHLRFFTRKTVEELFEHSGYFLDTIDRTKVPLFSGDTSIPYINKDDFNTEVIKQIQQDEEVETLQFILRAFPGDKETKYVALNERYLKVVAHLERLQSQQQHTQAELEKSQAQLQHTQAELDNSQSQQQHTQAELEKSQAQLQHTQAELDNSQSQPQHTQAELERSQFQLQHTQVELERSQSQLQDTQAKLDNSQFQLQHIQAELERLQALVQQTETEKERSHLQHQQTQMKLERSQAQLQHTQAELSESQAIVSGMESSKFWKLRTVWFRLKQAIGLTDSSPSPAGTLSPQTTNAPANVAIPEVINLNEINFKATAKDSASGFFDGINGSSATKIKVPMTTPLNASGWAILADEGRVADKVIITYGKKNSLVAVASLNLARLDVVQALNNPAYRDSGWSVTLNPAILPSGQVVLKAWAYNAARKEATLLNSTTFNSRLSHLFSRLKYYYAVLRVKGVRYGLTKLSKKIYYKLDNSQPPLDLLPVASPNDEPYSRWLSKNFPREADLRKMAETVEIFSYKPVVSVVMPVYNTPEHFLREVIESVLNQIYPYWELCIADDASTKPYIKTILEEYISKDSRIKVVFRTENGHISLASNSALEIATGEFVALLDHDDLLTPDALYEVALLLNKHPDADMIYSDEDKIDQHNQLREPFFKPDWCPDSFLSRMYTCHLGTYRRSLVTEIRGFRAGFEGSQDYDLVLRLTEKAKKILHIPKILYHWRIHPASTASSLDSKTYAVDAAKRALSEAIDRRGEPGIVTPAPGTAGYYVVRYHIDTCDLVSIIIPTKNLGNIVDKCLLSIFEKTTYPNYEVILVDNGSTEQTTFDVIKKWKDKEANRFKCYSLDIPFNYAKINNVAVKESQGKYLLFLNNDTEVLTPDWIEAMVEQAQRPSIGAVGALLLYPDNTIQHAGVVAGIGGVANHCHKHFSIGSSGYFNHLNTVNNFSSVTAACLMCRRDVFQEVGGFEEALAVAFNDVDFCFKLVEKGYRNIYLPHVILYHYESKSRGVEDTAEKLARFLKENEYMHDKWKEIIKNDPCYNPNLTRKREDYSIEV